MDFLIIQTAFIGDVILVTGLPGKLKKHFPEAHISFLVRKGNEELLSNHPDVDEILIWDKSKRKYKNLIDLSRKIRKQRFDYLINLQRFGSMGYLTWRSKAKHKIGFDKNPFSWSFTHKVKHVINDGRHEIDRNNDLISSITDESRPIPKLYPSDANLSKTEPYTGEPYIVIAPASAWFTKQLPEDKWVELCDSLSDKQVLMIGSKEDMAMAERIRMSTKHSNTTNLCGKFTLMESTALISKAERLYCNDSAPMHMASAVNTPTTAFYCSTIPEFGFGPLAENSNVIQTSEKLDCKPCGIHGYQKCPKGHFKCGKTIQV